MRHMRIAVIFVIEAIHCLAQSLDPLFITRRVRSAVCLEPKPECFAAVTKLGRSGEFFRGTPLWFTRDRIHDCCPLAGDFSKTDQLLKVFLD